MHKPPLGLKPRGIFLEERLVDVKQAINDYFDANQEVPTVWIEEYNVICAELYPNKRVEVTEEIILLSNFATGGIVSSSRI